MADDRRAAVLGASLFAGIARAAATLAPHLGAGGMAGFAVGLLAVTRHDGPPGPEFVFVMGALAAGFGLGAVTGLAHAVQLLGRARRPEGALGPAPGRAWQS